MKNRLERCRQIGENCFGYNALNERPISRDRQRDCYFSPRGLGKLEIFSSAFYFSYTAALG